MYGNFRDPVGLVGRMLRTATYESSWPLFQAVSTAGLTPLDTLASRWEPIALAGHAKYPQVLVVGAPRSGSTLVSQVLTQQLDVSYFPNVSAMFPSAPIWISQRLLGRFEVAPSCLKSFYGNTPGLRGINDGFHIWNRWFGEDRYCIGHHPTTEETSELRTFFAAWHRTFPKPLLNKNNRNVDGIDSLADLLPNAFFVVVERDPVMVVQSLLRARKFIQGDERLGWGLFSNQYENVDPIEATCQQVGRIRSRTQEQLERLPAHRYLAVDYDAFCSRPDDVLRTIAGMVPALSLRPGTDSVGARLAASHRFALSQDRQRQIVESLARHVHSRETHTTVPRS